jgi:hypothetical protein
MDGWEPRMESSWWSKRSPWSATTSSMTPSFFPTPSSPLLVLLLASYYFSCHKDLEGQNKNYSFGHTTLHVVAPSSRKNRSNSNSNFKRSWHLCVHGDGALSSLSLSRRCRTLFLCRSFFRHSRLRGCDTYHHKTLITFDPNPNYLIQIFRLLLAKVVTSADKMTNMAIIKLSILLFFFKEKGIAPRKLIN